MMHALRELRALVDCDYRVVAMGSDSGGQYPSAMNLQARGVQLCGQGPRQKTHHRIFKKKLGGGQDRLHPRGRDRFNISRKFSAQIRFCGIMQPFGTVTM